MGLAQLVSKFFLVYESLIVFQICLFYRRFTSMNMASDFFSKMGLSTTARIARMYRLYPSFLPLYEICFDSSFLCVTHQFKLFSEVFFTKCNSNFNDVYCAFVHLICPTRTAANFFLCPVSAAKPNSFLYLFYDIINMFIEITRDNHLYSQISMGIFYCYDFFHVFSEILCVFFYRYIFTKSQQYKFKFIKLHIV